MEKIKTFLDDKEAWSEKKDENKRLDEEEAVRTIQHSSPLKRSMPTTDAKNWSLPYSPRRPISRQPH
jgi:hypothetical protein